MLISKVGVIGFGRTGHGKDQKRSLQSTHLGGLWLLAFLCVGGGTLIAILGSSWLSAGAGSSLAAYGIRVYWAASFGEAP